MDHQKLYQWRGGGRTNVIIRLKCKYTVESMHLLHKQKNKNCFWTSNSRTLIRIRVLSAQKRGFNGGIHGSSDLDTMLQYASQNKNAGLCLFFFSITLFFSRSKHSIVKTVDEKKIK